MARPKKEENVNPVRRRIGEEFWKLLRNKPLSQITVSELVKKAECNRTTFYYYFDNVDDLAWQLLKETIPVELPKISLAYFTGEIENVTIKPETMWVIERMSILIGRDGSSELYNLAVDALKKVWIKEFSIKESQYDEELNYLFDFTASGIVGIISRYGRSADTDRLKSSMLLINKIFSEKVLEFVESKK